MNLHRLLDRINVLELDSAKYKIDTDEKILLLTNYVKNLEDINTKLLSEKSKSDEEIHVLHSRLDKMSDTIKTLSKKIKYLVIKKDFYINEFLKLETIEEKEDLLNSVSLVVKNNDDSNDITKYPICKICQNASSSLDDVKLVFKIYDDNNINIRFGYASLLNILYYNYNIEIFKYIINYFIDIGVDIKSYFILNIFVNQTIEFMNYTLDLCDQKKLTLNDANSKPKLLYTICKNKNSDINIIKRVFENDCYFNSNEYHLLHKIITNINLQILTPELLNYMYTIYIRIYSNIDNLNSLTLKIFKDSSLELINCLLQFHHSHKLNIDNNNFKLILSNKCITSETIDFCCEQNLIIDLIDCNGNYIIDLFCKKYSIKNIKSVLKLHDEQQIHISVYSNKIKCFEYFCERLTDDIKAKLFTLYLTKDVLSKCIVESNNNNNNISVDFSKYCTGELFNEIIDICIENNLELL